MTIINFFEAETDLYCKFWEQSTWKSPPNTPDHVQILYFWMHVDISEFWAGQTWSQDGWVEMEVPLFQPDHLPQGTALTLGGFCCLFLYPQMLQTQDSW